MSTTTTDDRRRSFDQMVELYARARPAPPREIIDRQLGGRVERHSMGRLQLARRKP